MTDREVALERAVRAVLDTADWESVMFEDAQTPVEDWALDALARAYFGRTEESTELADRFEQAAPGVRLAYIRED